MSGNDHCRTSGFMNSANEMIIRSQFKQSMRKLEISSIQSSLQVLQRNKNCKNS